MNVVKVYGLGGVLEVGHGASDSELVEAEMVAEMVAETIAVEISGVEVEGGVEDEGEAGCVGVWDGLVMGGVGVATGGGAVLVHAVVGVTSSVTVCVSTMVTGGAVVCAGWMETTEMSVAIAVTVSVASPAEAVTVSVFGEEVTVSMIVVAACAGEVPPSMGTTEYRGRKA